MNTTRREKARAETRRLILDAAEKVFADRGFAAATLEGIAEEAGYTRGAVYYNFADKDELFIAILDRHLDQSIGEISAILTDNADPAALFEAMRERSRRPRTPREHRAAVRLAALSGEFWLYAVRNPSARAKLALHQRHRQAAYAAGIKTITKQLGIQLPIPADHLAAVVLALDEGLPRQRWLDPESIPDTLFYDTLQLLVSALETMSRQATSTA